MSDQKPCPNCGRLHRCQPKAGEVRGAVRPQSKTGAERYEAAQRGIEVAARIRRDKGLVFALHCDGLTNSQIMAATGFGREKVNRLLREATEKIMATADRRFRLLEASFSSGAEADAHFKAWGEQAGTRWRDQRWPKHIPAMEARQ